MAQPIKMILIGDSGSGKTGALASLLSAGYNVRLIDLENGVEALLDLVTNSKGKYAADSWRRLSWLTLNEKMKVSGEAIVPASAKVWPSVVGLLAEWKVPERTREEFPMLPEALPAVNLGSPMNWGDRDVFVVDTLGALGLAAKNYHLALNSKLGQIRDGYAGMKDVGSAQEYLDTFLKAVAGNHFKGNVILITHMVEATRGGRLPKVSKEGEPETDPATGLPEQTFLYPSTIGRAQTKNVSKDFNHVLYVERVGSTATIYTRTRGKVLLKTGAPTRVKDSYKQETGLVEYFTDVKGGKEG